MNISEMYNYMESNSIGDNEVLQFATCMYGYNEDTLNTIVAYYTEYQTLEQYLEFEDYDTYKEYYMEEEEE